MKSEDINTILDILEQTYPDAGCALDHTDIFELLICVVLSAQTTDKSVNKVTPALFAEYPDAAALSQADPDDVAEYIRSIGMYKTKSKNIVNLAKALVADYDGSVPDDYDSLIFHGRNCCDARKPKCTECPIKQYCKYYNEAGN